jgi:ABC-type polysaccharide transport system, permease component
MNMANKKQAKPDRKAKEVKQMSLAKHVRKEWKIYTFLLIPITYYIIFKYIPMVGNAIAFRRYTGGSNILGHEFVKFRYFQQFLRDGSFWNAFFNTLRLSISYIAFRFPTTLIFALLINEIRKIKWKKTIQTVSYLPHFISLVVVCGMVKEIVSLNGPINALLSVFGMERISFLAEPKWFDTIYIASGVWQSLGWGTILYLTAMTNINTELYEAAAIDGANRLKQTFNVTIPGIISTIMTLLILDIGGIITAGNMQKIMLLYNPLTQARADIIGTYVYRMGITGGNFSYATAVGLFEGIIGLVLVTSANLLSRKFTESSLW